MSAPTTCTVVVSADGGTCGKPAVTTFASKRTGEVFAECVDHAVTPSAVVPEGPRKGQAVEIVAGRNAGEVGIIDRVCERTLIVCLGRTGDIVRVLHESVELYD